MLYLKKAQKIGQGMERVCYLHPEDTDKVVKVPQLNSSSSRKQNLHEYKSYLFLSRRHKEFCAFSKCFGFVETDMGQGLVCQCIRDFSGEISRSLYEILIDQLQYPYQKLVHCVEVFCANLILHNIQLFDINAKNIVINIQEDGEYKAVSVDLKGRYGNKELIPLSTYIPFFSRKKISRRSRQLLERMKYFRDNGHLFRNG